MSRLVKCDKCSKIFGEEEKYYYVEFAEKENGKEEVYAFDLCKDCGQEMFHDCKLRRVM